MLLLQEFDLTIKDKKGTKNVVADHLSRLKELPLLERQFLNNVLPVNEDFPDEQLFLVQVIQPWYADFVNYIVSQIISPDFGYHERRNFFIGCQALVLG